MTGTYRALIAVTATNVLAAVRTGVTTDDAIAGAVHIAVTFDNTLCREKMTDDVLNFLAKMD